MTTDQTTVNRTTTDQDRPIPGKPIGICLVRFRGTTLAQASAAKKHKSDHVCFEDGLFYTVNKALYAYHRNSPFVRLSRWFRQ